MENTLPVATSLPRVRAGGPPRWGSSPRQRRRRYGCGNLLADQPIGCPPLRTLRRIRSDVAFLKRAMTLEPQRLEVGDGRGAGATFADAAAHVRGTGPAPALATLDRLVAIVRPIACSASRR